MKRAEIIRAIKRRHVEEAIKYIYEHNVPQRRNSTKYSLRYGEHNIPGHAPSEIVDLLQLMTPAMDNKCRGLISPSSRKRLHCPDAE